MDTVGEKEVRNLFAQVAEQCPTHEADMIDSLCEYAVSLMLAVKAFAPMSND